MFPLSAALGVGQALLGTLLPKGKRPTWQIPGAANEELAMARREALATDRPGGVQARDQIRRNATQTVNQVQRNATSAQDVLSAAVGVNNNTNKALLQDSQLNDQFRFNAKRNLASTLGRYAGYQREKFIKDNVEPYNDRVATKQQLIGSGLQNLFGGINSASNQKQQQQYLDYLTGGGSDDGSGSSGGGFNFGKIFNTFSRPRPMSGSTAQGRVVY